MARDRYLVTYERGDTVIVVEKVKADDEAHARRKAAKRHPEISLTDQKVRVRVRLLSPND